MHGRRSFLEIVRHVRRKVPVAAIFGNQSNPSQLTKKSSIFLVLPRSIRHHINFQLEYSSTICGPDWFQRILFIFEVSVINRSSDVILLWIWVHWPTLRSATSTSLLANSTYNIHYKLSHTMAQMPYPGPQSGPGRVRSDKSSFFFAR